MRASLILLLALVALPASAVDRAATISSHDRREALRDMSEPSEAIPINGARPASDWMRRGRIERGNNPGKFRTILPWFVVMETATNRVDHARVELRGMRLLVLSRKTGQWRALDASNRMAGGYFANDLVQNLRPLQSQRSPDGRNDTIVTDVRYVAHFWPASGRQDIDPDDVAGVLVSIEARINTADYAAGARYVMDAGADYWLDHKALFDNWKTSPGVGVGRMKRLTPTWRKFYMTTASAIDLQM
jgi:hypothetical protein